MTTKKVAETLTRELWQFVDGIWDDQIIPTLHEYIKIPNKSPAFDSDWAANGYMEEAANLLLNWVPKLDISGLRSEILRLPGRTPLIFIEIPATQSASEHTVLLYGHYDKQPEFDGWHEGFAAWQPVQVDGKLYGRGGADDGYALFASLTAIAALQAQKIPHSRCVLLIEGCEESGSFDLPFYVDHLKPQLGNVDLVVCLDAECGNYEQLWLTSSLRGMLPGVLSVEVLTEGQHSGAAGGIVPSSFRLLRQLLDRVEDSQTGELVQELQVEISSDTKLQLAAAANILGPVVFERFPFTQGTQPQQEHNVDALIANTWKPSLAVVGLDGAPSISNAGNTLRPGTAAKLVFRLPPTLDAQTAGTIVKEKLEKHPPNGARVTFEVDAPQTGWCAPSLAPWLEQCLHSASNAFFNKPMAQMGMGGTIPFMKMLGDAYPDAQFVVTGVLGPMSNAHGPNEFLEITTGKKLTASISLVLAQHANQYDR